MAEEHSNIQEANDLLKSANKLDPNSTLELEIEWYTKRKQNGGVQTALKVVNSCKPFFSKVLLITLVTRFGDKPCFFVIFSTVRYGVLWCLANAKRTFSSPQDATIFVR